MNKGCLPISIFLWLVLLASVPSWAGLQEMLDEYESGDYRTALNDIRTLAEQGNAEAQLTLGGIYFEGQGVRKDIQKAVKWYRLAAEQGMPRAQGMMGALYSEGKGVPQDYGEAIKWTQKSAEGGDKWAQYNMGVHYFSGKGISKDLILAHNWMKLAAEQDLKKAVEGIKLIEEQMTEEQLIKIGKSQEKANNASWVWKIIGFFLSFFVASYIFKHILAFTGLLFYNFLLQKLPNQLHTFDSEFPKPVKRIIWVIQSFSIFQQVLLGCLLAGVAIFLVNFHSLQPTWLYGLIGLVFTNYSLTNTAYKKQKISLEWPSMEMDILAQADLKGTSIGMFVGIPTYILIFVLAFYFPFS